MSTAGPDLVADLAPQVVAAGGTLVDAPILGRSAARPRGRGGHSRGWRHRGRRTLSERVLSAFGSVRHVGPLGSAARLKLVANSMLADVILAAAELQVAGEDVGLDPDDVFFVLNRVAPSLEPRRAGLEGHHAPTLFALRDLRKDVDLAMALYRASTTQTPLTRWSREQIDAAAAATPDQDISAVAQLYRQGLQKSIPSLRTA